MSRRFDKNKGRMKKVKGTVPGAPTVWEKNRKFLERFDLEEQFREMSQWIYPMFRFLLWWTCGSFMAYNYFLYFKRKRALRKRDKKNAELEKQNEEAFAKRREEEKKRLADRGVLFCKICGSNDRNMGGLRVVRDPDTGDRIYVHEACVKKQLRESEQELKAVAG
jgi:hypothetical protein